MKNLKTLLAAFAVAAIPFVLTDAASAQQLVVQVLPLLWHDRQPAQVLADAARDDNLPPRRELLGQIILIEKRHFQRAGGVR